MIFHRFSLVFILLSFNIIHLGQSAPSEINELSKKVLLHTENQPIGTASKLIDGMLRKFNKRETSAEIHGKIDELSDTNESEIFHDIEMNPDELTELERKRRAIQSNDQLQQRNKRSLSTYDLYNINPLYESSFASIRPSRSLTPPYLYGPLYTRYMRSVLEPSFYAPSEWTRIYPETLESDETENYRSPFHIVEDEDGYNRYPLIFDSSADIPYDNLQLQQEYNTKDWAMENEGDDDVAGEILSPYDPFESYYK